MDIFLPLRMQHFRAVIAILTGMYATSRILESRRFIQHGSTSVYTHSRNVAYLSLKLAATFRWHVNEHALIRGALLHDYFLYDWHDHSARLSLHGFRHPSLALRNAQAVYALTDVEVDIIKHHMFPLTIVPPRTREGLLICLSDKICSLYETFKFNERHVQRRKARS